MDGQSTRWMSIISHGGRNEISNRAARTQRLRASVNRIHQTLEVLLQAGRVRLDAEEIDALTYALEGLAPERVDLI